MMRPHVAVVGGGIAGLAAALDLAARADVTLFEAGDHLGGAIRTVDFAGTRLDTGPDSFLARRPEMIELVTRLGLADQLTAPATGAAAVWSRGALRPLPAGLVLGVPSSLGALARSGIVSRAGVTRAALDRVLPRTWVGEDVGVGELVRRRLGREVQQRLVDPLLGGIHAGRSERLSAAVAAPQLLAAARSGRSLLRSLSDGAPAAPSAEPVFLTTRGGLGTVVAAAEAAVRAAGATVRLGAPVERIEAGSGGVTVWLGNEGVAADAVVVATPRFVTNALLPEHAGALAGLRYASVVLTLLAYRGESLRAEFTMSGFLVPRVEGRLLTAASWSSSKWAHLGGAGVEIVRASCGRIDDDRAMALDDGAVVEAVHEELADAVGLCDGPISAQVVRWPRALPQFEVGHATRAATVHASMAAAAPRVALAGAAYEGLGLPACVASGRAAAARALEACSA